ncbi:MAG: hypothetical protein BWK79_19315 [Beggiatoa sp. IS2]|nr:MAG: hypothetical protein BWK79_19315 [Beggiatoa sp. IS2]
MGNILSQANRATITSSSQMGGATHQQYVYDDLYRLTHADGTFDGKTNKQERYTLDMQYDSIHNIVSKNQNHVSQQTIVQPRTTYNWSYKYQGTQPHAPTHIGNRTFTYDANGNQLGWTHDENGTWRQIIWDEENRIQQILDNGHIFSYKYNHVGERVFKQGPQGETVYVNQFFSIRGGSVASKHVFAGTMRLATKMTTQENTSIAGMNTLSVNPANATVTMKSLPVSPRTILSHARF